jgi:flavodoxin
MYVDIFMEGIFMKELVLYYSRSGKTRAIAEKFAAEKGFDICEVVPRKKIGVFKAFLLCPKAISGGKTAIETLNVNFGDYEQIHVFAPIWAGNPAPPINTALGWLPAGTKVTLNFVSSGGTSNKTCKIRDDLKIQSHNDIKGE